MAHVLVTGGAGYIGSHTCIELLNAGYEVTVADDLRNSHPSVPGVIQELTGKPLRFIPGDIRDTAVLDRCFEHRVDAVVHFAALKSVPESVREPLRYYRNNVNATLLLCERMQQERVRRLVFSSSATVYRMPAPVPTPEHADRWATCPYGWTKLMCEQILQDLAASDPAWSVLLLRYFNPVGAHESGRIGEDPAGVPGNLMPYITQVAVGRRPALTVCGNDYPTPDGTGVRDYIHVVDLARGHVRAVDRVLNTTGAEAVNLGTGAGYSVLDVVRCFEETNQVRIPYHIGPRRPGDVAVSYADPGRARKVLGWTAEKTLPDMCRDAWRWQQNNPNGYSRPGTDGGP